VFAKEGKTTLFLNIFLIYIFLLLSLDDAEGEDAMDIDDRADEHQAEGEAHAEESEED
jgi:hypothetical protein